MSTISALPILPQLISFGLIGLMLNLIGYCLYLLLVWTGLDPKISMSILFVFGTVMSFFGNARYAFAHDGRSLPTALRFAIVYALGWGLNLAILIFFVDWLGYPHQIVQAIAIVLIAAFLFVTQRNFVFRTGTGRGA